jgi:hypothetical protein
MPLPLRLVCADSAALATVAARAFELDVFCDNQGMSALLAALVGGALAIAGGVVGALTTGRGERGRWRRDTQLRVSTELLSSLQELVRRMIDLAYLTEKPPRGGRHTVSREYRDATIGWNSSIYAALLVSPPKVAELVQGLDREVDRLVDRAMEKPWSRAEFREERIGLGRLAAVYLNAARAEAGWPPITLKSVWAWDSAAPPGSTPHFDREKRETLNAVDVVLAEGVSGQAEPD